MEVIIRRKQSLDNDERVACLHVGCRVKVKSYWHLNRHLKDVHNWDIEFEELTFKSETELDDWLDSLIDKDRASYPLSRALKRNSQGLLPKHTRHCSMHVTEYEKQTAELR